MFKVNNKDTKVNFIVNFKHISHLCSSVSIVNFEYVIAGQVWLSQELIHETLLSLVPSYHFRADAHWNLSFLSLI